MLTSTDARMIAGGRVVLSRALQRSEHRALLAGGDLLAASAATLLSIRIWAITAGFPFDSAFVTAHAAWLLAVPIWLIALLPSQNARVALSPRATIGAVGRGVGFLLVAYLALYFYLPPRALPRLVALYILWEGALVLLAWRLFYAWFFGRPELLPRLLVVGSGDRAAIARRLLRREHRAAVDATPFGMVEALERSGAREIVVACDLAPQDALLDELLQCQARGMPIVTFAQLYEDVLQRIPVAHIDREWLLASFAEAIRVRDASMLVKRSIDIIGALIGTIVLTIVTPTLASAIWIEDRGPVFYRQSRVGRGGSIFHIVKFRTMVPDAEEREGARWAAKDDPRVTRVGRLLRRARLDELPNLLNVLRGDMSLVGPRPERPELVAMLEQQVPFYRTRLMARPGLTGWAQVNRPYDETIADATEKLEYDLYYLKHRTLAFDLQILLKTVGTVLGLKGR